MPSSGNVSAQEKIRNHLAAMESLATNARYIEPFHLSEAACASFLQGLHDAPNQYPDLDFWYIVHPGSTAIPEQGGLEEHFSRPIRNRLDFYLQFHPDYLEPYFHWTKATYLLTQRIQQKIKPLENSIRISVPLRTRDGTYYWYSQHSTILQIDQVGKVRTYLNTYYLEGKWSELSLKPFESFLRNRNQPDAENEQILNALMAPYIIDAFTNSELELLSFYTRGMDSAQAAAHIGWSKHTLNEYNSSILKKARRLFQFPFRTARDFADFCQEK
jgi:hypothetical protein